MKRRLTPLALSVCLLGTGMVPAFAASSEDINARTRALEKQLAAVQKELTRLKSEMKSTHHAEGTGSTHHRSAARKASTHTSTKNVVATEKANGAKINAYEDAEDKASRTSINGPEDLPQSGLQYIPIDFDVPGQSFVSTGPYLGVPLQYSGSNLIINNPNVNYDVSLLNLRKNVNQRLTALGLTHPEDHSHLLLSGVVEAQGNYKEVGGSNNSSDINVTNVSIDSYILGPSSWTSGLISLTYDNSIGAQEGSLSSNSRTLNSRVIVDKAFIVIGDFMHSPIYATFGQMYVPFGVYGTSMVSSPLTKLMARVQTRAALIGFQQQSTNALYGSAYIFRGDSSAGSLSRINNGGLNLGYRFTLDALKADIGGGVIGNIADSQGMQSNGNSGSNTPPIVFNGFGGTNGSGNEHLVHRVPAYDIRGLFSISKFDFVVEYIIASTTFSPLDLTMKSHAARPQALNAEIAYTFEAFSKPTSISVGYGMTKDAVALALPAQRISATLNTSWWRNTLQSLEFRHDMNYAASAYSTGSGVPGPTASGKPDNMITAQFDIFF